MAKMLRFQTILASLSFKMGNSWRQEQAGPQGSCITTPFSNREREQ